MKTIIKFLMAIVAVFLIASCASKEQRELAESQRLDKNSFGKEMQATEQNQSRLLIAQPLPTMDNSLERDNLTRRTNTFNNKNKVSYIYLIDYGQIMAFYAIKGKVSSVNSMLSNPEQIVQFPVVGRDGGINRYDTHVVSSAAEDGSYGTNGDGIFFFTTDGTYVEWNGKYMLCDKPLRLTQQPMLVREIN